MAQTVKNLLAMQETQVQSLGQKDPLEKGMTTHSNILAWRISWTEEIGGLQSIVLQLTHTHAHTSEGMTTVPLRGGDIWITTSGEINDPSSGARCRLGL